jgi:hypothetical protein
LLGAVALLWPDSARTKNPIAKMAATQKINRAALDIFITVGPLLRASIRDFVVSKPADALRFSAEILRTRLQTRQAESLSNSGKTYQPLQ